MANQPPPIQAPNNQGFQNFGSNAGIQNGPQQGGTQHNQQVQGNINSGAAAGQQPNESQENQERRKAYDGFFKKYLSKDANQKLGRDSYPIKKGKILIINNEKWPRKLCNSEGKAINEKGEVNRKGTNVDRDALKKLAEYIRFEAEVKQDRTVQQMKEDLDGFANGEDWKNLDAAIVCILSHGGEHNSIFGTGNFDEKLEFAELLKDLSQQTDLQGKPKIFIVQACRGGKYDNREASNDGNVETSDKIEFESAENLFNLAYPIFADALPSQGATADSNYQSQAADILVLWATGWGFVAWRNECTGSYFIQELTKAIKDKSELHMIELMEHVIPAVRNHFQAGPPDKYNPGECPQFLSSLDRKLYLKCIASPLNPSK